MNHSMVLRRLATLPRAVSTRETASTVPSAAALARTPTLVVLHRSLLLNQLDTAQRAARHHGLVIMSVDFSIAVRVLCLRAYVLLPLHRKRLIRLSGSGLRRPLQL